MILQEFNSNSHTINIKELAMFKKFLAIFLVISILTILPHSPYDIKASATTTDIRLIVDGEDITELSAPVLVDNRTLIPVRFVAESLGAEVGWNEDTRTVTVDRENDHLRLIIDSRLVQYDLGNSYQIIDVAPTIINSRTYVPLRVVSNALGIGIEWDGDSRTIFIDSDETSNVEPFYDFDLFPIGEENNITGKIDIDFTIPDKYKDLNGEVRLLLLDGDTGTGFIKDKGLISDSFLTFIPNIDEKSNQILAVCLYDENGNFIAGDGRLVSINLMPEIDLSGLKNNNIYQNEIIINPEINFLSQYVVYEFKNKSTGKVTLSSERDPYTSYSWSPSYEKAGDYIVKAIACDIDDNCYESESYNVTINVDRKLSLDGVNDGDIINSPITLIADRNYNVKETQYIIKNPATKEETLLKEVPYGSYKWFPSIEDSFSGEMDLLVRVKDTNSRNYSDIEISKEDLIFDFDDLDNMTLTQYPDNSDGSMSNSSKSIDGKSIKLSYDFTTMIEDDQSIAFIEFDEDGRRIKNKPVSFSMWVYGDESDHWLRCRILDSNDRIHKIDFAPEVDWNGWKKVTAIIPDEVSYPIKLKNIYLAEIDYNKIDSGKIYIDNLTANYAEETLSNYHDSEPIRVNIDASPKLILKGVGPGQVLTSDTDLSVISNFNINEVEYYSKDSDTGIIKLLGTSDGDSKITFLLNANNSSELTLFARAYCNEEKIESDEINIKIYNGETFTSKPITEKSEFKDFASVMAVKSQAETGMSAALQTAQAILETGWGQYIPVDKYTGTFSNNLFGIKGSASNGSVIVNTWEVYNGAYFRVDDYFRAYNNPYESWVDHKKLLLEKDRYSGFRDVMYDYTLGAFAIKRAGYATDPDYPGKLIYLIEHYNLYELDKISI